MINKTEFVQIAMDGPAGSGKSSIAKALAKKLNFTFVNSGGLYRCYAIALRDAAVDINDHIKVVRIIEHADISQKGDTFYLNGVDVSKRCYSKDISTFVPTIAKIPEVRSATGETQFKISRTTNIVIEGRDTTTELFPNALVKVYVTADAQVRAQRRWEQSGKKDTLENTMADLLRRDEADLTRSISPLRQAPDAYVLDTTNKTEEECINILRDLYLERAGKK